MFEHDAGQPRSHSLTTRPQRILRVDHACAILEGHDSYPPTQTPGRVGGAFLFGSFHIAPPLSIQASIVDFRHLSDCRLFGFPIRTSAFGNLCAASHLRKVRSFASMYSRTFFAAQSGSSNALSSCCMTISPAGKCPIALAYEFHGTDGADGRADGTDDMKRPLALLKWQKRILARIRAHPRAWFVWICGC